MLSRRMPGSANGRQLTWQPGAKSWTPNQNNERQSRRSKSMPVVDQDLQQPLRQLRSSPSGTASADQPSRGAHLCATFRAETNRQYLGNEDCISQLPVAFERERLIGGGGKQGHNGTKDLAPAPRCLCGSCLRKGTRPRQSLSRSPTQAKSAAVLLQFPCLPQRDTLGR